MFLAFYYYLYLNVFGFLLSGIDKLISRSQLLNISRVSEKSLLILATLGAFPGETMAFILFNHKTRKESFRHAFVFATALHLVLFFVLWMLGFMKYMFKRI